MNPQSPPKKEFRERSPLALARDPAFREKVLLAHHGAGLIQPQGGECLPQPEFLAWHQAQVFKEPARE